MPTVTVSFESVIAITRSKKSPEYCRDECPFRWEEYPHYPPCTEQQGCGTVLAMLDRFQKLHGKEAR